MECVQLNQGGIVRFRIEVLSKIGTCYICIPRGAESFPGCNLFFSYMNELLLDLLFADFFYTDEIWKSSSSEQV